MAVQARATGLRDWELKVIGHNAHEVLMLDRTEKAGVLRLRAINEAGRWVIDQMQPSPEIDFLKS